MWVESAGVATLSSFATVMPECTGAAPASSARSSISNNCASVRNAVIGEGSGLSPGNECGTTDCAEGGKVSIRHKGACFGLDGEAQRVRRVEGVRLACQPASGHYAMRAGGRVTPL